MKTILATILLMSMAFAALPESSISQCTIIDQPGAYHLVNDIDATALWGNYGATSSCINITANDVTLDCNGYTIQGKGQTEVFGVEFGQDGKPIKNAVVKNCIMKDLYVGVEGFQATDSLATNNTIINGGMVCNYCNNVHMEKSTVNGNFFGIYGRGSTNVYIQDNVISSTKNYGISVDWNGAYFDRNKITVVAGIPAISVEETNCEFTDNVVIAPSGASFGVCKSTNNVINPSETPIEPPKPICYDKAFLDSLKAKLQAMIDEINAYEAKQ